MVVELESVNLADLRDNAKLRMERSQNIWKAVLNVDHPVFIRVKNIALGYAKTVVKSFLQILRQRKNGILASLQMSFGIIL